MKLMMVTLLPALRWSYPYSLMLLMTAAIGLSAMQQAIASADDLAYYLPPGEVVWLGASEDEVRAAAAEDQPAPLRMLMLTRENEQSYDRGSLILIPELGTHPMQSMPIRLWYQGMPAYGFYSYAIQPPTTQVIEFNWQQDSTDRYPQGADLTPLQQALAQRLTLAIEHAAGQPGPIILVAQGVSAALVTDLLAGGEYPQIDALIMVGAHYPQWQLNQQLATTTAQLRIPVLDFIPQHTHSWVAESSERRVQQAQRHQHPSYRQRDLQTTRSNDPRHLLHQLYGWLQSEDY